MLATLRNAWKIPELRKKLLFTLLILLIYRLGNVIPVPYVDGNALQTAFSASLSNTVLGLYNVMSGSAFSQATVLALSIQPYINASIIVQLLTIALPPLERMAKEEGEEGKKKLSRITRYTTVGLGLLMGWAYYTMLSNGISGSGSLLTQTGFVPAVVVILAFTAGSSLVMWLGDQITESGIGNGISMILFANIISRIPVQVETLVNGVFFPTVSTKIQWWEALIMLVIMLALVVFIVFINDAERRIPIQYAKRVVGRKVYGGQNTNLPIKVNMSGVMPVIFAQSIATVPATIFAFTNPSGKSSSGFVQFLINFTSTDGWVYPIFYFLLIIAFAFFYAAIQYDPVEIANNLKKNGGFIPGFRPGRPTADFIGKVIHKITFFGALYLAIVCLLPLIADHFIKSASSLAIGGTSVIIVVGVALETVQALEAQMLMRHYKGFLD